ncbi:hypothetical protein [Streptomyces carpinensis]|uniref:Uncharacterized protein n=1 Tax=Streptomyces carpinensis TaxID=66369 RepID=A0ABV1W955_9ACTN|nr:hypothetical protein [Streptomyces carpinensis]
MNGTFFIAGVGRPGGVRTQEALATDDLVIGTVGEPVVQHRGLREVLVSGDALMTVLCPHRARPRGIR